MSSDVPRCKECGMVFDTIELLEEHVKNEKQEVAARNKGFDDG
ncbi:hypothetical protein [Nitrososphaera viennensis]|uniref:C2H2-type domain-containing protein n=2 Tax=Nitrososphaera viennensis TaxID=1034015 RepID=A0A060HKR3_9ARCH|nr:hypothetical protein [Nitrososphaera viennensis]AIC15825.1 hypothetical protein NVIE_015740 [Nitrososphaera viennensis EN76]UVS67816.1 hypothetical protein NWT39_07840 [Nitrososphaera viennensis]